LDVGDLDKEYRVLANNWYLLTLRSSTTEDNTDLILSGPRNDEIKSKSYSNPFPKNGELEFDTVRIGVEYRKKKGFEGCFRQFKMLSIYATDN
jgi:hypothetical protein